MFEKCIKCNNIGISCVPNLWLLPFHELIKWCIKRQEHRGWSNQKWAEESNVPVGTIKRIKAGDYEDCKYSTIKSLAISAIGGTTNEFACTELVEKELRQLEQLEQQAARLSSVEKENEELKAKLYTIDEQNRQDIRVIKEEYQEQINFLVDEVKAWRACNQK